MSFLARFRFDKKMWKASKAKYAGMPIPNDADSIVAFILARVPDIIREIYEEDGVKLDFCSQSDVVNTSYVAYRIKGKTRPWAMWEAVQAVGTFRPGMLSIQVSRKTTRRFLIGYPEDWKDHVDTAGHELGHYVDYVCGYPSDRADFLKVYEAERDKFDTYTATSSSEYFADTFWLACMYPKEMKEELPQTHAWFEEYLSN